MSLQVRSDYTDGKFLFEWDPAENTIGIVQKNMFYRVKLIPQGTSGRYRVLEKRPKAEMPHKPATH